MGFGVCVLGITWFVGQGFGGLGFRVKVLRVWDLGLPFRVQTLWFGEGNGKSNGNYSRGYGFE